jgi:CRP-like cAMP-binding protein
LQAILPMLKEKEILKGEVLFSEGDGADFIYFMKEGQIMLYVDISEEVLQF